MNQYRYETISKNRYRYGGYWYVCLSTGGGGGGLDGGKGARHLEQGSHKGGVAAHCS